MYVRTYVRRYVHFLDVRQKSLIPIVIVIIILIVVIIMIVFLSTVVFMLILIIVFIVSNRDRPPKQPGQTSQPKREQTCQTIGANRPTNRDQKL